MSYLAVAVGGFLGAILRYIFPYGILWCNLLGAFGLAFFYAIIVNRQINQQVKLLIGTGFMGAFTTFSSFSVANVQYLVEGQLSRAVTNMLVSLVGGIILAWVGFKLGRQVGQRTEAKVKKEYGG